MLAFGGAILLPSAGHWYAGKRATIGMGVRLAGAVAAGASLAILRSEDGGDAEGSLLPVFWLGAGTVAVGAIYDIATASSQVEAWNRNHSELRPTVLRTGDGYGLGIAGRF
jgi:hypothetical protein